MKLISCQQNSEDWRIARCGAITASMFSIAVSTVGGLNEQQQKYVEQIRHGCIEETARIIAGYKTKVKRTESVQRGIDGLPVGVQSDASKKYASDVAIERISGKPYGAPVKAWVLDRGHELEAAARIAYEARTGKMALESGIVKTDDDWFGYSTDGFVDDDGLIEIKCPVDTQKILAMFQTGDVSEYMHQMQGGMWITGREWCDFLMYVPDLETVKNDLYIKRVFRDDAFIETMEIGLLNFREQVIATESIFRNKPKKD